MTEMLEKYLDFCKENHKSLEYISEHAEEDCFFDFYYNGATDSVHVHYDNELTLRFESMGRATDSVHVHYDNGMKVEMNYDDIEELESAENDLAQTVKEVVDTLKEEY